MASANFQTLLVLQLRIEYEFHENKTRREMLRNLLTVLLITQVKRNRVVKTFILNKKIILIGLQLLSKIAPAILSQKKVGLENPGILKPLNYKTLEL